ncbi:MAG: DoxX family protein [Gammaproteobacteria bacterium]|nr:DoxX family protein [Gammaproteobacteria bacterium]
MNTIFALGRTTFEKLDDIGAWVALLSLRLLLAWEFWGAGVKKFNGENWFARIQDDFPFPLNVIPTEISWFIATWAELAGAVALVLGLGTRFAAVSLIILDIVALVSVHADNGYNVCNNGFKLPLIYLMMLIPLLLAGPGKASLDAAIARYFK